MPVDRSKNRKANIGGVIIVVLLAVSAVIFFIQPILKRLHPRIEIVALMGDAGALDAGSAVWIAGRTVGVVERIDLRPANVDSTERVAVVMTIPKKFAENVRRDSKVRITSARVIGEPVVDITPGSAAAAPVQDHDTVHAVSGGSLQLLMTRAMSVSSNFRGLFAEMMTLQNMAKRNPQDLQRLNASLRNTTAEFHSLMSAMEDGPMSYWRDPGFQTSLRNVMALSGQLRDSFAAASERARRAQSDAQPALARLTARADTIQRELAAVNARITTSGGGLLLRAQKDSAITEAVHGARLQLDSLIAETKRNPLRFWF